jgi:MarR family transcriptional regulator for hemolysin
VRLLDNLERRGLIERREDETDRRARGIHLTPAGRELAIRVAKLGSEIQRRVLAGVGLADLDVCHRIFDSVERQLDERLDGALNSAD